MLHSDILHLYLNDFKFYTICDYWLGAGSMADGGGELEGYDALSSLMGPFKSAALYKRFGSLNARSLLLQQAELLYLERKLHAFAGFDKDEGLPFYKDAGSLIKSGETGENDEQWRLLQVIRGKLNEYSRFEDKRST
jgi:hypothetical protein